MLDYNRSPITHKDEVFMTAESIKEDTLKTFNTAFWNTFANVLSLIIGTVMVPIITRVLNPEELGIASTFIANRNTIVIFVTLSAYSYVNHAMIDFDGNKGVPLIDLPFLHCHSFCCVHYLPSL